MEAAGALDSHRTDDDRTMPDRTIGPPTFPDQIRRRRSTMPHDSDQTSHSPEDSIGRCRRFVEEHHDRGPIEPRSSRDRGSFVVESIPRSSDGVFLRINSTIDAQSTHNLATIRPRSGHDRVPIVGLFEAKFKTIHPEFEATTPLSVNRSHDASIPLPRPPLLPSKSGLILP